MDYVRLEELSSLFFFDLWFAILAQKIAIVAQNIVMELQIEFPLTFEYMRFIEEIIRANTAIISAIRALLIFSFILMPPLDKKSISHSPIHYFTNPIYLIS